MAELSLLSLCGARVRGFSLADSAAGKSRNLGPRDFPLKRPRPFDILTSISLSLKVGTSRHLERYRKLLLFRGQRSCRTMQKCPLRRIPNICLP